MKMLKVRTAGQYNFYTIIFDTREEAEANAPDIEHDIVRRYVVYDGFDGYLVRVGFAGEYHEFLRLVA